MALFRALSTRRSQRGGGYDRLLDETHGIINNDPSSSDADHHHHHHQHRHHDGVLKRVTSVPASMLFGSSWKKPEFETAYLGNKSKPTKQQQQQHQQQQAKSGSKKGSGKSVHPVFSLFEGSKWRKKKMTANPDFSRYIEYLKEGGMWNKESNSPAIYYK